MAKFDLKQFVEATRTRVSGIVRAVVGRSDSGTDQHDLPPRPSRLLEGVAATSATGLLVALACGIALTSLTFIVINTFFFGSIVSHYQGWTTLKIDEVAAAYARIRGTSAESVAGDKFASELKDQLQLELEHLVVDEDTGNEAWEAWRAGFHEPAPTPAIRLVWSPRAEGPDPKAPSFKFALELRREDSAAKTDILAEYYPLEPVEATEVGVFERTQNREERVFHPVTIYHYGILGLRPIRVLNTSEQLAARFFLELQDFAADSGVDISAPDGTQAELTEAFIREVLARRLGRVSGGLPALPVPAEGHEDEGFGPPPIPMRDPTEAGVATYQTAESMTAWARRVNGSDLLGFIQYGTIIAFWSLIVVLFAKSRHVDLQYEYRAVDQFDPSSINRSLSAIDALRARWHSGQATALPCIPVEMLHAGYAAYAVAGNYTSVPPSVEGRSQSFLEQSGTGFAVVRFLIWLIPSIGFIGTVLGIGNALLGTGAVLSDQQVEQQAAIQLIASRLGTAFDTTFIALIVSIPAMFLMNWVQRKEEELIHESSRATLDVIVSPKGVLRAAAARVRRPARTLRAQEPVRAGQPGVQRYWFRAEPSETACGRPVADLFAVSLIAFACIIAIAFFLGQDIDAPVRSLAGSWISGLPM